MLPVLQQADLKAARHLQSTGTKLACQPGCDWCCYLRVEILPPEALHIQKYVRDNFCVTQTSLLLQRLREHTDKVSRLTSQQHQTTNIVCPFLVDSKCSIYDARPLRCRGYTSLDANSCEYSFNNPQDEDERRPTDPELDRLWEQILESQMGQSPHSSMLELGSAIHALLAPE